MPHRTLFSGAFRHFTCAESHGTSESARSTRHCIPLSDRRKQSNFPRPSRPKVWNFSARTATRGPEALISQKRMDSATKMMDLSSGIRRLSEAKADGAHFPLRPNALLLVVEPHFLRPGVALLLERPPRLIRHAAALVHGLAGRLRLRSGLYGGPRLEGLGGAHERLLLGVLAKRFLAGESAIPHRATPSQKRSVLSATF